MAAATFTLADVISASSRIRDHVHKTPVMRCSHLDQLSGFNLFFKCENFQKTGSFKVSDQIGPDVRLAVLVLASVRVDQRRLECC